MQLGLYRTTFAAARLTSEFTFSPIGKTKSRGMKSIPTGKSLNSPFNFTITDDDFPTLASSISAAKQTKRRTRIDLQTTSKRKSEEVQNNDASHREASTGISHFPSSKHGEASSISTSDQYDTELPSRFWKNHSSSSKYHDHGEAKRCSPVMQTTCKEVQGNGPLHREASTPLSHSSSSKHPKQHDIDRERGEANSISISDQYDTELPSGFWKNRSSSSQYPKPHYTHSDHGESRRRLTYTPPTYEGEPFDICFPETRKTNEKHRKRWADKIELPGEIDKHIDDIEEESESESAEEFGQVLRPGMVLFKNYISLSEQIDIVSKCRELGCGPGGFYRPGYNDGAKLRLYMMCLGLDWDPQTKKYGGKRRHDDAEPPVLPQEFTSLVRRVIDDSHSLIKRELKIINVEDELPAMSPDVCIVNYYSTNGRLGLHQDCDESPESLKKGLPVVSISLGDSAEFLYGNQRDIDKAKSVVLESGDVLVFGGESRHVFHGVTSIFPDTAPPKLVKDTNLRPGRLNLTFRKY